MSLLDPASRCFECNQPAHEDHHVVPQSRGGTKTVPLCSPCHGKVHDAKRDNSIAQLTKEGMVRAKVNGTKSGKAIGRPREHGDDVREQITALRMDGMSFGAIAAQVGLAKSTVVSLLESGRIGVE